MPTAAQLPQIRNDLVRLCSTDLIGMVISHHVLAGGDMDLPQPECDAAKFGDAMEGYQQRLRNLADMATLFHVSAEMTAVADAARRTMPGYRLHPEDLPAERGLIVFDAVIGRFDIDGDLESMSDYDRRLAVEHRERQLAVAPAAVIAAMWGPALTRNGEPGVLVVTWTDSSDLVAYREKEGSKPEALTALRAFGALAYHDETVLPFGDIFDEEGPDRPIRNESLGTLIATWLLMGQPITSSLPEPLPRQTRRALQRANLPVPEVRVVKLRQPKHPHPEAEQGAGRTYTKRWVVRGHWRNQWYPSRNDHRPIYIPTHIKGPDGAQLIVSEKVYDWSR